MDGLGQSATQQNVAFPNQQFADPFEAALMQGQVMNGAPIGAQMGGGMMAEQLPLVAAELARQIEPPKRGDLQNLMAMMGAVQPQGKSDRELSAQLASRHYVNPPVSGGGGKPDAVGMPAYQQKMGAGGKGPRTLGDYLRSR